MNDDLDSKMPRGAANAWTFQVFNTASFSIVLGAPMLLFFKELGASATVLGVVASLPPFLMILQIPAARFVEQVGYRAFVLKGWMVRTLFIAGMAGVAFLPERLDASTRMILMLLLLVAYNVSRGISTCGFLPWITQLIPESVRGRFLSMDQMCSSLSALASTLMCGWWMAHFSGQKAFGSLFLWAGLMGSISLMYLKKIPDVPVPESSRSREPVPWMELLEHGPFLKLLTVNVIVCVAFAGAGILWIPLLRDVHHYESSKILYMVALAALISGLTQYWIGKMVDRVGSRPIMITAIGVLLVHFILWGSLGAKLIPLNLVTIFLIQFTAGFGASAFNLANTRLLMGTVPPMGRSHFFAMYSVCTSLALGVLPAGWGLCLDLLKGWHSTWWGWEWNGFSFLYLVALGILLVAFFFLLKIREERSITTEEFMRELLVESPGRVITRLLRRGPQF